MSVRLTTDDVMEAVGFVAGLLGEPRAYRVGERVHVPLGSGWSLAISGDDMDRLRVEACIRGSVKSRMWANARDRARLADLAREIRAEARGMSEESVL